MNLVQDRDQQITELKIKNFDLKKENESLRKKLEIQVAVNRTLQELVETLKEQAFGLPE
jgi:hypothetical protein